MDEAQIIQKRDTGWNKPCGWALTVTIHRSGSSSTNWARLMQQRSFSSDPEASSPPVVDYSAASFAEQVAALGAQYERGEPVRVLFAGGARVDHMQALSTLAEATVENVHQFALPALVKERRMQTQSSIRKAFDAAAEEGALLFFDRVDMLFNWHHPDSLGGEEEPSSLEYFFQRVEAYEGVVALALATPEHIEAARAYDLHLIVDFS